MTGGGIGKRKKIMLIVNNWVLKVGAVENSETILCGANTHPVNSVFTIAAKVFKSDFHSATLY